MLEQKKRFYPKNVTRVRTRFSPRPGQVVRLDGRRFGYLKVLSRDGRIDGYIGWLCRCDCGAEVTVSSKYLVQGKKKACCLNGHRYVVERKPGITAQYESEYQSWRNMHERCEQPRHKNFPNYGGRGISVCPEWQSFETFLRDMGRKPDPKFTVERNDTNGHYVPGNCRWASRAEQRRNKRNSVYVTYQGKRMLLIDVIAELGLSKTIVRSRLAQGWTLEQAIAIPKGGSQK